MHNFRVAIVLLVVLLFGACLGSCAPEQTPVVTTTEVPTQRFVSSPAAQVTPTKLPKSPSPAAPTFSPTITSLPPAQPTGEFNEDCSPIEHLALDAPEAQQIVAEFVANYKAQFPTEYMGMAILHSVDRLGEWAVIQGSVSGEGMDVIAARLTPQGYQIAGRYTITAPLESFDSPKTIVPGYFLKNLPEAPPALFTCLDQSWLLGLAPGEEATPPVEKFGELAYLSAKDGSTQGQTGLFTIRTDGSQPVLLFSGELLIVDLAASPDGQWIALAACPGSLANDCLPDRDLDIMLISWEGGEVQTLTGSPGNDRHPSWSPDGKITFDSDRSGTTQIYIMNADGSDQHAVTNPPGLNTEPKWSPDGAWIAYHCQQGGELRICLVTPEGELAENAIAGTTPVWSPLDQEGGVRLAYLCFQGSHSDLCTVRPDGSEWANLTISPADEHNPAWSPNGNWLAFVSNRGGEVDIYKVCATCPGLPEAVRLTDEPQSAGWPAWSPDGSRLAFVSGQTLMLVNPDRSGLTYLVDQVFLPPIWRP
jgi:Tol biopolymer transport system component